MPRKCSAADLDHAIQAYLSGEGAESIANRIPGLGTRRLLSVLSEHGLRRTREQRYSLACAKGAETARSKLALPMTQIVARYEAGESENVLAAEYGVSRSALRRRLELFEVSLRDQSEANQLLAEQTPLQEHRRRIAIAQKATRGRKQTFSHRCKIAATREARGLGISPAEELLASWLHEREVACVPQRAIGPYNVDLGIAPVAVEILGGAWHASKQRHAKRSRYILNEGWHIVFVWSHGTRSPLTPGVADYIVSFLKQLRRDPSAICEYRVIRGDGQELSGGSANSDEITFVVPGYEGLNGSAVD